jgi:hypothetical protein
MDEHAAEAVPLDGGTQVDHHLNTVETFSEIIKIRVTGRRQSRICSGGGRGPVVIGMGAPSLEAGRQERRQEKWINL